MDKNVPQNPSVASQSGPAPTTPTSMVKPPGGKKPHKVLWIVLVILLVAVAGYLGWKYLYKKKATPTQTTAVEVKKDIDSISHTTFGGTYNLLYPDLGAITDTIAVNYNQQIFESLVQYRDITKIEPELATSWTNPDSTTWLFNLKPNVKFHDGNTMTADDVKYSLETIKASNGEGANIYTSTIKSVEAVNPNQVKVVTTTPDTLFLEKLTYLFIIDSKAPKNATAADKGTGPYKIKDGTTPTDKKLELTAFDDYHDGHVYTRNLSFFDANTIEDPEKAELDAVESVNSGKVDLTGFLSYNSTTDKAKSDNLYSFSAQSTSVVYIGLNSQKISSPLAKKAVREAVYTAIDVPTLLKAIKADSTADVSTQSITKAIPGYDESITHPAGDAAKAKQLLATAGYPNGITITMTTPDVTVDIANEVAKQLKAAGITLKVVTTSDYDKFFANIDEGNLEFWNESYGPNILDGSDTFKAVFQNANYKNAEIDALIKKSDETLHTEERISVLQEISRKSMEDFAIVPLYTRNHIYVSKQKYEMTQDVVNGEMGVYFWKVYQK